MVSLKEAFEIVIENIKPTSKTKSLFLNQALNQFIAEDFLATRDSPNFSNSAMDGFGLRYSNQKEFNIKETILAGEIKNIELKDNECIKIMTGAKIPDSIDTVVPFEDCEIIENKIVIKKIKPNANIRYKGEEFNKNELLIKKGEEITPSHIALLASQGVVNIKTYKKPSIAIISNGNELKEPFEYANEYQIYNSNSYAIWALLKEYGFDSDIIGIKEDNLETLKKEIDKLKSYDVIISTGGISFGDADLIYQAFKHNGLKEFFRKINLKPGKPTMFGKMENSYIFALPGNPLSSFSNTLLLIIPALRKLSGAKKYYYNFVYAKNKKEFKFNITKDHIAFGTLKNGEWEIFNEYRYSSYMITTITNTNSFSIFYANKKIDTFIKVIPFKTDFIEENLLFKG